MVTYCQRAAGPAGTGGRRARGRHQSQMFGRALGLSALSAGHPARLSHAPGQLDHGAAGRDGAVLRSLPAHRHQLQSHIKSEGAKEAHKLALPGQSQILRSGKGPAGIGGQDLPLEAVEPGAGGRHGVSLCGGARLRHSIQVPRRRGGYPLAVPGSERQHDPRDAPQARQALQKARRARGDEGARRDHRPRPAHYAGQSHRRAGRETEIIALQRT